MRTFTATPADIEHRWFLVDAEGMVLGRLASEIARVIRGKHKATFTPHMDTGDYVIVINAAKVRVTGRKLEQKHYFRHTGYMGHERFTPLGTVLAKHPDRVIERAVYGMLPKTALGRQVLRRKLRVFAGAMHPHAAQQPTALVLNAKTGGGPSPRVRATGTGAAGTEAALTPAKHASAKRKSAKGPTAKRTTAKGAGTTGAAGER